MVRNFDMSITKQGGIAMLHVTGLTSFDEAYQYMHRLYADSVMSVKLSGLRALIISDENLELLLKYYSIDEYAEFYESTFTEYPALESGEDTLDGISFE